MPTPYSELVVTSGMSRPVLRLTVRIRGERYGMSGERPARRDSIRASSNYSIFSP